MARTNKYTSLNFNDIYDKKPTTNHRSSPSSSSSSSFSSTNKTVISNSRIHGNMLVLTRPSPKPIAPPPRQPSPPPPDRADSISLRPLGRTGSPSPSPLPSLLPLPNLSVPVAVKTNKFVPPHLRPGFNGREEKPEPEVQFQVQNQKQTGFGTRSGFRQSPLGSPVYKEEEGRPKSGGGYETMNRPRSSGSNRPFSSG